MGFMSPLYHILGTTDPEAVKSAQEKIASGIWQPIIFRSGKTDYTVGYTEQGQVVGEGLVTPEGYREAQYEKYHQELQQKVFSATGERREPTYNEWTGKEPLSPIKNILPVREMSIAPQKQPSLLEPYTTQEKIKAGQQYFGGLAEGKIISSPAMSITGKTTAYSSAIQEQYGAKMSQVPIITEKFPFDFKSVIFGKTSGEDIKINSIISNIPFIRKGVEAHEYGHILDFKGKFPDTVDYTMAAQGFTGKMLNIGSPKLREWYEGLGYSKEYLKNNLTDERQANAFQNYIANPNKFKKNFPEVAKVFESALAPSITEVIGTINLASGQYAPKMNIDERDILGTGIISSKKTTILSPKGAFIAPYALAKEKYETTIKPFIGLYRERELARQNILGMESSLKSIPEANVPLRNQIIGELQGQTYRYNVASKAISMGVAGIPPLFEENKYVSYSPSKFIPEGFRQKIKNVPLIGKWLGDIAPKPMTTEEKEIYSFYYELPKSRKIAARVGQLAGIGAIGIAGGLTWVGAKGLAIKTIGVATTKKIEYGIIGYSTTSIIGGFVSAPVESSVGLAGFSFGYKQGSKIFIPKQVKKIPSKKIESRVYYPESLDKTQVVPLDKGLYYVEGESKGRITQRISQKGKPAEFGWKPVKAYSEAIIKDIGKDKYKIVSGKAIVSQYGIKSAIPLKEGYDITGISLKGQFNLQEAPIAISAKYPKLKEVKIIEGLGAGQKTYQYNLESDFLGYKGKGQYYGKKGLIRIGLSEGIVGKYGGDVSRYTMQFEEGHKIIASERFGEYYGKLSSIIYREPRGTQLKSVVGRAKSIFMQEVPSDKTKILFVQEGITKESPYAIRKINLPKAMQEQFEIGVVSKFPISDSTSPLAKGMTAFEYGRYLRDLGIIEVTLAKEGTRGFPKGLYGNIRIGELANSDNLLGGNIKISKDIPKWNWLARLKGVPKREDILAHELFHLKYGLSEEETLRLEATKFPRFREYDKLLLPDKSLIPSLKQNTEILKQRMKAIFISSRDIATQIAIPPKMTIPSRQIPIKPSPIYPNVFTGFKGIQITRGITGSAIAELYPKRQNLIQLPQLIKEREIRIIKSIQGTSFMPPIQQQRLSYKDLIIPQFRINQRTMQIPRARQKPIEIVRTKGDLLIIPPYAPPTRVFPTAIFPPSYTPKIRGFALPSLFGIGGGYGFGRPPARYRTGHRYSPSLTASILGIRGKAPYSKSLGLIPLQIRGLPSFARRRVRKKLKIV